MTQHIQYRVRQVSRYIVTRADWTTSPDGETETNNASSQHGEFDNFDMAYAVGYALCKAEHDRLGWLPTDERITYPDVTGPFVPQPAKTLLIARKAGRSHRPKR